VFLDDPFTDPPGTDLLVHSPAIGGAWVYDNAPGAFQIAPIAAIEASNRGAGNLAIAHNLAVPPSADYTAETRFQEIISAGGNDQEGIVARYVDNSNYVLLIYDYNAATLFLWDVVGGAFNLLGSVLDPIVGHPGHTFLAQIDLSASSVTAKIDGVTVIGPAVTANLAPGSIGLWYVDTDAFVNNNTVQTRVRGYT
jgi:hypothetical protein